MSPGVCKCCLGESANAGALACFLRHYKDTTFAATVLTMAGDAVRFLDFISKKHHPSYIIHLPSSGFSQLLDDSFYLSGRKRLAGGFVARRLQLFPKLGAAANPSHQMAYSRARAAVWEVHQRQFLFAICSNGELIHDRPPFFSLKHNNQRSLYCQVATDNAPDWVVPLSVAGTTVHQAYHYPGTYQW